MTPTSPKVYLISHMQAGPDYEAFVKEQASGYRPAGVDFPSELAEQCGRNCYDSWDSPRPGGNEAYLANILGRRHGEVIENAVYAFAIFGISKNCAAQMRTYRAGVSFCVRSSRFCDDGDQALLFPDNVHLPADLEEAVRGHEASSRALYQRVVTELQDQGLSRKECRQAARYVLPEGREASLTLTANARALRHFLEQRCDAHSDYEIRLVANLFYKKLLSLSPHLFNDYLVQRLPDGTFTLSTPNRKV